MSKLFYNIPLLFCLSSCRHNYYVPCTQNVPLFHDKNEARLSVSAGASSEISTMDVQAAYSFTDKFAATFNYMYATGGSKSSSDWGSGNYLDGGLGYFKAFDNHVIFEIYGGFGGNTQHHQYFYTSSSFWGPGQDYHGSADLAFTKVYLQPSFGLTFNSVDIAIATNLSNVNFYKIRANLYPSISQFPDLARLSQNRNSILFEPSLTIRGGWKYVKVQLQLILSRNLSHYNLNFEKEKLSLGVTFAFAERFKK